MASSAQSSTGSSNSDATRSTVHTPASDTSASRSSIDSDIKIIEIAPKGDVVLRIEHETKASKAVHLFRTSSTSLQKNSRYFDRLLRSGRFSEGVDIAAQHEKLISLFGSVPEAPSPDLPVLDIRDIGRISNVKAIDTLLTDFLNIVHERETQVAPPVINFANLAIVADRFDALEIVKSYFRRKKLLRTVDGRATTKADTGLTEEKVRQRVLVAALLDYPPWLEKYTARLISRGWVGKELDLAEPLWWDLPMRVEEELAFRRECVLDTIQSVQSWALALYTSRERQCRLGYENSTQCDSFQLGEVVKFFAKMNTLRLQGKISGNDNSPEAYQGDLYMLLDVLRQVPEYQIDKFHSHCGIRTRLIPLLDLLQHSLQYTGICLECWQDARREHAWIETKPPLLWTRQNIRPEGHTDRHSGVRAMFTATEKLWN